MINIQLLFGVCLLSSEIISSAASCGLSLRQGIKTNDPHHRPCWTPGVQIVTGTCLQSHQGEDFLQLPAKTASPGTWSGSRLKFHMLQPWAACLALSSPMWKSQIIVENSNWRILRWDLGSLPELRALRKWQSVKNMETGTSGREAGFVREKSWFHVYVGECELFHLRDDKWG